ncbi:MAG: c-type cytochrome [Granulosicoccus sp.]
MVLSRTLLLAAVLLSITVAGADEKTTGKELLTQRCLICHGTQQTAENRLAPPIVAVKQRYLKQYPDRDSFINAITQWVKAPSEDRSLMQGALRKFGLMPTLSYADNDVAAIAKYIYEVSMDKPAGFDEHQETERGKNKPE